METRKEIHLTYLVPRVATSRKLKYLCEKLNWIRNVQERSTRRAEAKLLLLPVHRTDFSPFFFV